MRNEIWKPVPSARFARLYQVSSLGRVRRSHGGQGSIAGRVLTPKIGRKGYCHVDLSRDDMKVRVFIHQLVSKTFLPTRPSTRHYPNHIDGNKRNNAASNLEWLTVGDNNRHARSLGLVPSTAGELNGRAVLTAGDVTYIRELKGKVGARTIADLFGVCRSTIQWIHQGKHWRDLRVRQMPTREAVTS
jgi:hypothetical protein